jgi:hypothetical protein
MTQMDADQGHPISICENLRSSADSIRFSQMTDRNRQDALLWERIVAGLEKEVLRLPPSERAWIASRLERIGRLQEELHALFLRGGGPEACRDCGGACCDRGRHHATLVNLLGFLLAGSQPPLPDFARPCPFLGEGGCLMEPSRRPFNCVTFICDAIEDRLDAAGREDFYARERELRALYGEFDARYAGSSLRGILIRASRLKDADLLAPAVGAVV